MSRYFLFFSFFIGIHTSFSQSNFPIPFLDSSTGLYGYKQKSNGKVKIKPLYRSASFFSKDGYAKVRVNDRAGVINKKGKFIVEPIFERVGWSQDSIRLFSEGFIGVKLNDKWGIFDLKAKELISPRFNGIMPFYNGSSIVNIINDEKTNYGIVNTDGKYIIEPIYNHLEVDRKTNSYLAKKQVNGFTKWGIISNTGTIKLPFIYEKIDVIKSGYFAVQNEKHKWGLYNDNLEAIYPHELDSVGTVLDSVFIVKASDHYTLMELDGSLIEPFRYKKLSVKENIIIKIPFNAWQLVYPDKSRAVTVYYDSISNLAKNVFQGFTDTNSYLFNREGNVLLKQGDYDSVMVFNEEYFIVHKNGLKGLVDTNGDFILSIKYKNVQKVSEKNMLVSSKNGKQDILNTKGENLTNGQFKKIKIVKEGYLKALTNSNSWSLYNGQLELITEKWENIGELLLQSIDYTYLGEEKIAESILAVKKDGLYGVIDFEENWVISPYLDSLRLINPNYSLVFDNGLNGAVNYNGIELFNTEESILYPYGEGCTLLKNKGKFGLLNAFGTEILPPDYDSLSIPTKDSLIYIYNNGRRYFMDTRYQKIPNGDEFKDIEYDTKHTEGFFRAKIQGLWGFVDYLARIRVYAQYDDVHYFSEDLAGFKLKNKWGYLNKQGRIVIQPMFDAVNSFKKGKAIVKKKGKWGLIDKEATPIIPFNFDAISETKFGNYLVTLDNKIGIYRQQDFLSIYPKFDTIEDVGNGTAIVSKNGLFGINELSGITIAYAEYMKVQYNPFDDSYFLLLSSISPN